MVAAWLTGSLQLLQRSPILYVEFASFRINRECRLPDSPFPWGKLITSLIICHLENCDQYYFNFSQSYPFPQKKILSTFKIVYKSPQILDRSSLWSGWFLCWLYRVWADRLDIIPSRPNRMPSPHASSLFFLESRGVLFSLLKQGT